MKCNRKDSASGEVLPITHRLVGKPDGELGLVPLDYQSARSLPWPALFYDLFRDVFGALYEHSKV